MNHHRLTLQTRPASRGLLLAASLALAACAPDALLHTDAAEPARVVLTASGPATLASLGDTARMSPRVVDRAGNALDASRLRWSLSAPGVVQPEGAGIYRAVGNGRVTIVAEIDPGETGVRPAGYWAGRLADSVTIEVRQRAVRLTLAPVDTAFGTLGASRQMRVLVADARGNPLLDAPPPLDWHSADPSVATVDASGLVRSFGEGATQITVQAGTLIGATTFTVHPRLPHTSCMVFAQRRQTRQSCVTLDLVLREREGGR
jgi:hypothetical protein